MSNSITRKTRNLGALLGLAASFAIGATATRAEAADTGLTTLVAVEYTQGSLLVQTAAFSNYVAMLTAGTSCTDHSKNIDTLKSWLSMGQAALLSGKRVKIYFTACGGANCISSFDIWN